MENRYDYVIGIEQAEEGGFLVHVPAFNGATTQGETVQEALSMARDLVRCHVRSRIERGLPIPVDTVLRGALKLSVDIGNSVTA